MPFKVSFELSDADIEHFRSAMREVKAKASGQTEDSLLEAARHLASQTTGRQLPDFVRVRLSTLDLLIRMLEDPQWRMEGEHRARVLEALAYFAEPADLIPDQVPGLGFLDDAILVELVVQELRPEVDAYTAFCRFRDGQRANDPAVPDERLETRRRAIYARIDARRAKRTRHRSWLFSIR